MSKILVGAVVGGILIFICQFLSWTVLHAHYSAMQYTPKQDSILAYLNTQLNESGGYELPGVPKDASNDDYSKAMKNTAGKPWAQIYYHTTQDADMTVNMIKNLITNIIMVLLFCWIIAGYNANSFAKTLFAALFTGMIVFLHGAYTMHIWYQSFDLYAHLADFMISWGIAGIWLGWWLNRRRR